MLEKKLYICNDVLTLSSKGRGSVCNTKGIEGGREEGSLYWRTMKTCISFFQEVFLDILTDIHE